jgi:anti-sigma regulatory factor (Ser/Thr protein kinase)
MVRVQDEHHLARDLTAPWVVPGGPSGVTLARRAARQQMHDFGYPDGEVVETVELLVSELTSNVVKHVGGRASLRVQMHGDVIRIEVCDANPTRIPIERGADPDAINGRGLLLVSSLATRWGFNRDDTQKCTWVEIEAGTPPPASS